MTDGTAALRGERRTRLAQLLWQDGRPSRALADHYGIAPETVRLLIAEHLDIVIAEKVPPSVGPRCAGTDPEAFWPAATGTTYWAKAVCRACAVQVDCLTEAMGDPDREGIWGGTTEKERRRIRSTWGSAA